MQNLDIALIKSCVQDLRRAIDCGGYCVLCFRPFIGYFTNPKAWNLAPIKTRTPFRHYTDVKTVSDTMDAGFQRRWARNENPR